MIYTVFLKAFWIAFSSKQAAGVSWERSNGAGEGEKELAFHSCVHATSSKTAKLLQLAGTQLCFLLAEDPFSECCRFGVFEPREGFAFPC